VEITQADFEILTLFLEVSEIIFDSNCAANDRYHRAVWGRETGDLNSECNDSPDHFRIPDSVLKNSLDQGVIEIDSNNRATNFASIQCRFKNIAVNGALLDFQSTNSIAIVSSEFNGIDGTSSTIRNRTTKQVSIDRSTFTSLTVPAFGFPGNAVVQPTTEFWLPDSTFQNSVRSNAFLIHSPFLNDYGDGIKGTT
jgi:hypothetical protein